MAIGVSSVSRATPIVVPGVSGTEVKASAFVGFDDVRLERYDGYVPGWNMCEKISLWIVSVGEASFLASQTVRIEIYQPANQDKRSKEE